MFQHISNIGDGSQILQIKKCRNSVRSSFRKKSFMDFFKNSSTTFFSKYRRKLLLEFFRNFFKGIFFRKLSWFFFAQNTSRNSSQFSQEILPKNLSRVSPGFLQELFQRYFRYSDIVSGNFIQEFPRKLEKNFQESSDESPGELRRIPSENFARIPLKYDETNI